jgi:membrane protein implicated in regulation of membrane protease activity
VAKIRKLLKFIHDDPILNKVVAGVLIFIIVGLLAFLALRFIPGGWASVFDAAGSAPGWISDGLKYKVGVPVWVSALIIGAVAAVFWRLAHTSETYQQRCIDLGREVEDLRQEMAQDQPVDLPPIQEIPFKGLCWRRTPAGHPDPVEAHCPTCDLQLHPTRRFSLNGSPVKYLCECCNKEIAKFDVAHHVLMDQVRRELERREREEQRHLKLSVAEKMTAGLPAEDARAEALRQIVALREVGRAGPPAEATGGPAL